MGWKLENLSPTLKSKVLEQDAIQNARQLNKPKSSPGDSVFAVGAVVPKCGERPALVGARAQRKKGKGIVEVVVTLIAVRKVEADDDNNSHSLKPARDIIAAELGLDDGDGRIRWEYGQCETRGQEGLIVKIEKI